MYLPRRHLVDPRTYPRFTLIGQAIGSAILAGEAMARLVPDVFVDTMGYPFAYPYVSAITGIPIAAYVHYPVISSDMISAMVANVDNVDKQEHHVKRNAKMIALLLQRSEQP